MFLRRYTQCQAAKDGCQSADDCSNRQGPIQSRNLRRIQECWVTCFALGVGGAVRQVGIGNGALPIRPATP